MLTDRRTPALLLALLYAVSGGLCLHSALWPMHPESPVGLLRAVAALGLVGGAAVWLLRDRLRGWVVHAAVALASVLIAVLAWQSETAVGVVALGPALIAVGLYAAHFFDLTTARAHAAFLVVSATAGAVAAPPAHFAVAWVVVVVAVIAFTEVQGRLARSLRTAATTDPLTGVANRRAWEEEAARHLARAVRTGEPLTIAIIDLDDFKEVNDRHGHGAGDALLRDLASGWARRLRQADLLGRYGGDEFVLCLPATDGDGAQEILQQLDATHEFAWSVGVATIQRGDDLAAVLARADAALYQQKRSGRTA
ncbi:GGDEF domain-containing protein [Blastococcus haudaquaticus]|uniref:Diguanylate cyclase (GGDEF) domain-containing protein n=1 Tax=Blastococcus haudaquaticus TaxID=1938745 RepID=A0A286H7E6_9ACTN|nr:GGDEF domain-containing protein [Blastococcus haudaquaticus]SOE03671.1 diguanylate cyclase (GGDEF) domain-containing protein [Blastococcus haudaquaticus]